ncbi:hypothetical protein B4N89_02530 [Embleya scabrispora]|uniref:Recombinase domain-containing protein n=1 Tax=Embleya scabrispora TaxID=159449 RepID=A0A1T3NSU3_9ACTN|nr:recombinase family protein [Embleya scabrispora]OPC79973.1 hypothetical protein B4N89_02530 [Embleya scabrispora]
MTNPGTTAADGQWIAFLYGRASVDPRRKGRSVNAQMLDNRSICNEQNWAIVAEFRDDDRSASPYAKRARDNYDEMVGRVAAGEASVIVAWEPSRLSRDTESWFVLRRALQNTGTLVCLDGEMYDMRIATQRQRLTREILDSETEADKTQARNARTARQGAAVGAVHGRILYGYRREYDPDTGDLLGQVPDTEPQGTEASKADIVVEIITRVAARESVRSIGMDLDARRLETPGVSERWNLATIRNIARNVAYIGRRVHRGQVVGPAQWPPITDDPTFEATFWAAVAVLADPSRRTQRGTAAVYEFTGIPTCGARVSASADDSEDRVCGGYLYRIPATRPGRAHQYGCRTCHRVAINMDLLDTYATAALLAWLEVPGRAEQVLKVTSEDASVGILAEIARLEAELAQARAMATARTLSVVSLAAAEAGILPALGQARARLSACVPHPGLARVLGPDARARWAEIDDVVERRAIYRAVMDIRVLPIGPGYGGVRSLPKRVEIRWRLGA